MGVHTLNLLFGDIKNLTICGTRMKNAKSIVKTIKNKTVLKAKYDKLKTTNLQLPVIVSTV